MGRGWKILMAVRRGADRAAARQRADRRRQDRVGRGDRARRPHPRPPGRRSAGRRSAARATATRSSSSTASPARSTGGTGCCPLLAARPPGRRRRPARARRLREARLGLLDRRTRRSWSPRRCGSSGVRDATVVGHSLGGTVTVALAEQAPDLVDRVVIVDMPPDNSYGDLGFIAGLAFQPVLGEALWTIKPDFSVRDGPRGRLRPGLRRPRRLRRGRQADDLHAPTTNRPTGTEDFIDDRVARPSACSATGKPLLVLMGAEEQIVDDPQRALDHTPRRCPGAETAPDRRRRPLAERREAGPRPQRLVLGIRKRIGGRRASLRQAPLRRSAVVPQSRSYCPPRHELQLPLQIRHAVRGPPYLTNPCSIQANLTSRLADAADLLIDFATLGEYGLEPVGRTRQGCAEPSAAPRGTSGAAHGDPERSCNLLQESGLFKPASLRVTQLRSPRSAPGYGARARRSRSKRCRERERRRVAALRKPLDGGVARRSSGAAARATFRRGPH